MIDIQSALIDFWSRLTSVFFSVRLQDFIDIAVMAFILYHGIRLVRETRAMQLLKGIAAMFALYFMSNALGMIALGFFFKNIIQVGIFLLVVLFQPELRSALEQMGRGGIGMFRFSNPGPAEGEIRKTEDFIGVLAESCAYLSERKTGALFVIERQTRLGDVIQTGTVIDALPSLEMIGNIFFVNSPLHDGAMVIRSGRLHAAGCYLPLSQNSEISRDLGTRHRAAVGISENSDAVAVVVSEETGVVSVAADSRLQRGLSDRNLRKLLEIKLLGPAAAEAPEKKSAFWIGRRKK